MVAIVVTPLTALYALAQASMAPARPTH
jgi:hypothetical protein